MDYSPSTRCPSPSLAPSSSDSAPSISLRPSFCCCYAPSCRTTEAPSFSAADILLQGFDRETRWNQSQMRLSPPFHHPHHSHSSWGFSIHHYKKKAYPIMWIGADLILNSLLELLLDLSWSLEGLLYVFAGVVAAAELAKQIMRAFIDTVPILLGFLYGFKGIGWELACRCKLRNWGQDWW